MTEIAAVEAMESFRRDTGMLKDISFPTISGAGPNGAIVHYRVTRKTNRRIAPNDLYLLDSGGQYEDGTTDITRTVAVGMPTAEMRRNFTLVLKGHIAIARAVFPDGTTGAQLDALARQYLWRAGLDYDHGTGHGVGSYLSVHEGPARISKLGGAALKRGMILSNEPGYYRTGEYGIRIENLVLVTEAATVAGAEKPLNAFETLTLAPIDTRLIEPALLTADERTWFNAYQATCAKRWRRFSIHRPGLAVCCDDSAAELNDTAARALVIASEAKYQCPSLPSPASGGGLGWELLRRFAPRDDDSATSHPFVFGEHRNAELLCFLELGTGAGTGDHVVGLLRHRTRHLGAQPFGGRFGLVAGHLFQRAGEHDGLAGDRRIARAAFPRRGCAPAPPAARRAGDCAPRRNNRAGFRSPCRRSDRARPSPLASRRRRWRACRQASWNAVQLP